jgi:hypothetical protein
MNVRSTCVSSIWQRLRTTPKAQDYNQLTTRLESLTGVLALTRFMFFQALHRSNGQWCVSDGSQSRE